jgi:hypothetical protein
VKALPTPNLTTAEEQESFKTFLSEESAEISQILNRTVSRFDILILFLELMKLYVENLFQQRIVRQQERDEWRKFMIEVVENLKDQGRWILMSSIGSGVLNILSGLTPFINHAAGGWIHGKLSSFSMFDGFKRDELFKMVQRLTHAMAPLYESTGRIHNTFASAREKKSQFSSDSARMSVDESTRTMDEILQVFRSIESTIAEWLRMVYEDAKSSNH